MMCPNILVLMADQLRQDALGCYGHPVIRTPHLDRLAQRGTRFTAAFCPTPICVASRMSFITGHRAARHRYTANGPLPGPAPELPTMMTLLQRAGYHTQGIGKMHFSGRHYGFRSLLCMEETAEFRADDDYLLYLRDHDVRTRYPQGLRDLLYYQPQTSGIPEPHSQSRWVANRSIEFLRGHREQRPGKPFFLWSSWIAPHPPFAPCAPYDSLYDPDSFALPVFADRPLDSLPEPARGHRARLQGAHLDAARIRRIRALYAGQVSQVDDCVGSVLHELELLGLADHTIILFVADHGEMLGDHGLSQKNVPYDPSVRVPMLLRWPDRTEPGSVRNDLVGLEDFLPTLIAELDLDYDHRAGPLPGQSLFAAEPREHYVIDYAHDAARWLSVRTDDTMYALWASSDVSELYDLRQDPHETRNLAGTQPARAAEFRALALAWEERFGLGLPFRTVPAAATAVMPPGVVINEARWPENLPPAERASVETYAEAFTLAVRQEHALTPAKLDLAAYKARGGQPLTGTPWETAWKEA